MSTPYITKGCPTTGGGQVITGNSSFLVDGIPVACVGDKATCPLHKTTATIITGDPYMQVMGKSVARVNDSLSCGCKLLPQQTLVVGDTGAGFSFSNQGFREIENKNESFIASSKDFALIFHGVKIDHSHFTPLGVTNSLGKKSAKEIQFLVTSKKGVFDKVEIEIEIDNGLKKICTQIENFSPGVTKALKWDGFLGDIYDSSMFISPKGIKFKAKGFVEGNLKSSAEYTCRFTYAVRDWIDTKINRKNNTINHTIRVSFKDGGAIGLNKSHTVPKKVTDFYKKVPFSTQVVSFQELKQLAINGMNKYWGRNTSRLVGKDIKIDGKSYEVFVQASESIKNSMDSLTLVFVTNNEPGYSANWALSQRVSYNIGYLDNGDGSFGYRELTSANNYFSETFAHEAGHDILSAGGNQIKSKMHNKTSTVFQNTIPGINYPEKGEIDLMMYGHNSRFEVQNFYDRVIASEDDVRSLIWIGGLKVI